MAVPSEVMEWLVKGEVYSPAARRERRARELAEDCQDLARRLARLSLNLKEGLETLGRGFGSMYPDPELAPPEAKPIVVKFSQWEIQLPNFAAALAGAPFVATALSIASACYLVDAGKGGATALAELLDLPGPVKIEAAGAAPGAAAGAALAFAVDAGPLWEEESAGKLEEALRGCLEARMRLASAYMVASRLAGHINDSLGFLAFIGQAPAEKIIQGLASFAKKVQVETAIADQDVGACLSALDAGRGSWTAEDGGPV